jgi:hypothetical protein
VLPLIIIALLLKLKIKIGEQRKISEGLNDTKTS